MPHQNLDADIMVAVSIWLLAISIFATMLVVALVQVVAEKMARRILDESRPLPNRWIPLDGLRGFLKK